MRGNELLDKMSLVDPAYVEAAEAAPKVSKLRRVRWGAVAACVCILMGATTVLAVTGLGTKIIEIFRSGGESGYELSADIVRFPAGELKGEIRDVPALIRKQFESYQPFMDRLPGSLEETFETRDEACDYVGFDRIRRPQWNAEEGPTTLYVYGTEKGDITMAVIETPYVDGDIRMQFFTNVYTENMEDEITIGTFTTENIDFSESFHTTKSGKTLHVIDQSAMESGYLGKDGYLVVDGILYELYLAYLEKDAARAEELLIQWAELF